MAQKLVLKSLPINTSGRPAPHDYRQSKELIAGWKWKLEQPRDFSVMFPNGIPPSGTPHWLPHRAGSPRLDYLQNDKYFHLPTFAWGQNNDGSQAHGVVRVGVVPQGKKIAVDYSTEWSYAENRELTTPKKRLDYLENNMVDVYQNGLWIDGKEVTDGSLFHTFTSHEFEIPIIKNSGLEFDDLPSRAADLVGQKTPAVAQGPVHIISHLTPGWHTIETEAADTSGAEEGGWTYQRIINHIYVKRPHEKLSDYDLDRSLREYLRTRPALSPASAGL